MNVDVSNLSPGERAQLRESLSQQTQSGFAQVSSETRRNVLTDRFGNQFELGTEQHAIVVGQDGIPQVIAQREYRVLDCGHVIALGAHPFAMCDFGHVICSMHDLYRCPECGRILCELEAIDEVGNPICPVCSQSDWWIWLVVGASIALALILAVFVSRL